MPGRIALTILLLWACHAHALEFVDSEACRANELPLGAPARVAAERDGAHVRVKVLANFGCQTTAGHARVREARGVIELSADTILPGHITPARKCTRTLTYRFAVESRREMRVVFLKDGQPEGEGVLSSGK